MIQKWTTTFTCRRKEYQRPQSSGSLCDKRSKTFSRNVCYTPRIFFWSFGSGISHINRPTNCEYRADRSTASPNTPIPIPIQMAGISWASGSRNSEANNAKANSTEIPRKRSTKTDEALRDIDAVARRRSLTRTTSPPIRVGIKTLKKEPTR